MKRSIKKEEAGQLAAEFQLPERAKIRILRHSDRDRRKLVQLIEQRHDRITAQSIFDLLEQGWTLQEIDESFDWSIPVSETIAEFLWKTNFGPKPAHLTARHENRPITSETTKEKRRRKRGFKRSSRA